MSAWPPIEPYDGSYIPFNILLPKSSRRIETTAGQQANKMFDLPKAKRYVLRAILRTAERPVLTYPHSVRRNELSSPSSSHSPTSSRASSPDDPNIEERIRAALGIDLESSITPNATTAGKDNSKASKGPDETLLDEGGQDEAGAEAEEEEEYAFRLFSAPAPAESQQQQQAGAASAAGAGTEQKQATRIRIRSPTPAAQGSGGFTRPRDRAYYFAKAWTDDERRAAEYAAVAVDGKDVGRVGLGAVEKWWGAELPWRVIHLRRRKPPKDAYERVVNPADEGLEGIEKSTEHYNDDEEERPRPHRRRAGKKRRIILRKRAQAAKIKEEAGRRRREEEVRGREERERAEREKRTRKNRERKVKRRLKEKREKEEAGKVEEGGENGSKEGVVEG